MQILGQFWFVYRVLWPRSRISKPNIPTPCVPYASMRSNRYCVHFNVLLLLWSGLRRARHHHAAARAACTVKWKFRWIFRCSCCCCPGSFCLFKYSEHLHTCNAFTASSHSMSAAECTQYFDAFRMISGANVTAGRFRLIQNSNIHFPQYATNAIEILDYPLLIDGGIFDGSAMPTIFLQCWNLNFDFPETGEYAFAVIPIESASTLTGSLVRHLLQKQLISYDAMETHFWEVSCDSARVFHLFCLTLKRRIWTCHSFATQCSA